MLQCIQILARGLCAASSCRPWDAHLDGCLPVAPILGFQGPPPLVHCYPQGPEFGAAQCPIARRIHRWMDVTCGQAPARPAHLPAVVRHGLHECRLQCTDFFYCSRLQLLHRRGFRLTRTQASLYHHRGNAFQIFSGYRIF